MIVTFFPIDPHYSATWADVYFEGLKYGAIAGPDVPLEPSMAAGFYGNKADAEEEMRLLAKQGHDCRFLTLNPDWPREGVSRFMETPA